MIRLAVALCTALMLAAALSACMPMAMTFGGMVAGAAATRAVDDLLGPNCPAAAVP